MRGPLAAVRFTPVSNALRFNCLPHVCLVLGAPSFILDTAIFWTLADSRGLLPLSLPLRHVSSLLLCWIQTGRQGLPPYVTHPQRDKGSFRHKKYG